MDVRCLLGERCFAEEILTIEVTIDTDLVVLLEWTNFKELNFETG